MTKRKKADTVRKRGNEKGKLQKLKGKTLSAWLTMHMQTRSKRGEVLPLCCWGRGDQITNCWEK